jgi:hypothetical protein
VLGGVVLAAALLASPQLADAGQLLAGSTQHAHESVEAVEAVECPLWTV